MNANGVVPVDKAGITHTEEKWDSDDLATVRIRVLQGHTKGVKCCQLIQNSQKVFSASTDCSIRIWNFSTGKCLKSYNNIHTVNISSAHSTPDGTRFLSCGWDKKLKYWDAETGKCLLEKTHDDFLTCCQISHQEKLIAVGSDLGKALRVYDLDSGNAVHDIKDYHESSLTNVKFAPADDKVITTSMDKTAKFFDLIMGNTTIKLDAPNVGSPSLCPS
uniref:Uncharacterized protein n=1 Tax=Arion vulgaris TaxID=1028688 RepID=A0A0B7A6L1_9EUPU